MLQNTLFNHSLRATRRKLLGGLERELHRPSELFATPPQYPGHGEQDCGMAIVSTGMHDAMILGGIWGATRFRDGEPIHICP